MICEAFVFCIPKSYDLVQFIDASMLYTEAKRTYLMQPEHISRVIDAYQNPRNIARFSQLVSVEEILAQHSNLHISLYVNPFEGQTKSVAELQAEVDALEEKVVRLKGVLDGAW
jgi:type I restriction-modification system DNA methylase subunit